MAKKSKTAAGSWIVTLKRTITVEIVCDDCTREQAESDPYVFEDGRDEHEIDFHGYEVLGVRPNE